MKRKDDVRKKLSSLRGRAIHDCIEIEDSLALRLTDYFFKKN